MSGVRLAVFDFDGTVCAGNTLQLLMGHLALRRGKLRAIAWIALRRKLRRLDSRQFKEAVLAVLRGRSPLELEALGCELYQAAVRPRLRPEALAAIAAARARGDRVVLLTGAFDFLIGPFTAEHTFDQVICCRTTIDADMGTARIDGCEMLGPEKPGALRAVLGSDDHVDWQNSAAYTDDLRDLPLLELFGGRFLVGAPLGQTLPSGVVRLDWPDPARD